MESQDNISSPLVQRFCDLFQAAAVSATATAAFALVAHAATPVEAAHAYASAGFPVIAWRAGADGAKVPLIDAWPSAATNDPGAAVRWWDRWPDAGVGVVLDAGWCVVDIDGDDGLRTLVERVQLGGLPLGPRVKTGRGYHLWYRVPPALQSGLRNAANGKVEFYVEARKRFFAAPPSIHPTGVAYAWEHAELPVPDLPADAFRWLIDVDGDHSASKPNVAAPLVGRHDDLFRALCSMRARGFDEDAIEAAAQKQNEAFADGPLPATELARIVTMVNRYPLGTALPNRPTTHGLTLRRYDEIEERPLSWGWRGVLPRRTLSTVVGEPGLGKSLVTCDLAARFTRGEAMPGGSANGFGRPVNVLMIAIEDDPEDTIKPRLDAAGADMMRVFDVRMKVETSDDIGALPTFPDDVPRLFELVREHDIKVIIVDPITACLSDKVNAWKDADVRRALAPLITLAREVDAVALGVMHVNKNETQSAINRVANSKAFTAVPRAVWWLGRDPEDEAHQVLVSVKFNVGPKDKSYGFCITGFDDKAPRVAWDAAPGTFTAKDLQRPPLDERRDGRYEAALLLLQHLGTGLVVESREIKEAAKGRGVGEKTLERVAKEFGVVITRTSEVPSRTTWRWPSRLTY